MNDENEQEKSKVEKHEWMHFWKRMVIVLAGGFVGFVVIPVLYIVLGMLWLIYVVRPEF